MIKLVSFEDLLTCSTFSCFFRMVDKLVFTSSLNSSRFIICSQHRRVVTNTFDGELQGLEKKSERKVNRISNQFKNVRSRENEARYANPGLVRIYKMVDYKALLQYIPTLYLRFRLVDGGLSYMIIL